MDARNVGKNIAKLRKKHNLTQKELADKLFVVDKTISRWECGYGYPDVTLLPTIAGIFGVTIEELVSEIKEDDTADKKQISKKSRKWIKPTVIFSSIFLVIGILLAILVPALQEKEHVCVFDQEVVSDRYRDTNATCELKATYYYSCTCGNKGTSTFEAGEPRGHVHVLEVEGDYKSTYKIGDIFDPTNMVVKKYCLNCDFVQTITDYTISPSTPLTANDKEITITSGETSVVININVESVGISNIQLKYENDRVYYAISGNCLEGADSSTLYLELISRYYDHVYYGKKDNILTIDGNSFEVKIDVTDLPANGSWFFPKLYIDGTSNDLFDESGKFHGKGNVKIGNSEYKLHHSAGVNYFPIVTREFSGVVDENASFEFTSVDLVKKNERVYMEYAGTCTNHTYETLSNQMKLQIKKTGTDIKFSEYNNLRSSNGYLVLDGDSFVLSMDVTDLNVGGNPYYTRVFSISENKFVDLDYLLESNVNLNTVEFNNLKYEVIYVYGSNAANEGYGCVALKITKM